MLLVINGLLVSASLFFALHAPACERGAAFRVSLVMATVWLVYAMPWIHEPYSVAGILYRHGYHEIQYTDISVAEDAIGSMLVLVFARQHRWAWGIWACFMLMLCAHVANEGARLLLPTAADGSGYTRVLDAAFLAQLAILFMLGGRGVCIRCSDFVARMRRLRRLRFVRASQASPGGLTGEP